MDFGDAIRAMKVGRHVCRVGWNGRGMHLYLFGPITVTTVGDDELPHTPEQVERLFGRPTVAEGARRYEPCIVMFTADKKHQIGWLASQTDMLAEDWEIVPVVG